MHVDLSLITATQTAEDSTVSADAPTHALYITAYLPSISGGPSFCLQSPCAILDVFVGSENDTTAPEWMHWSKPSLIFQHRTASFAELFINAATSRFNAEQVSGSLPLFVIFYQSRPHVMTIARSIFANDCMGAIC
jgi:hypothetical protein